MAIDTIKSSAVLDGAIATADIADDAVTSAKLDTNIAIDGKLGIGDSTVLGNKVHIRTGGSATSVNASAGLVLEDDDSTRCDLQFMGPDGAFHSILFGDVSDDDIGKISYSHSGNNMRFTVNTAERMRLTADGLTFNGDTAAANALDDYEEGTWTAQIVGSSSNPSSAVTMPSATYTKIGRLVFVQFQFSNVNTTGASGGVRISGLPFAALTSHGTGNILTYVGMTFPTTSTNISPYVSGTDMSFYYSTSGQGWAEITHNATSGVYLAVTATYQTNA